MYYLKQGHMICLDKAGLMNLFRVAQIDELYEEISSRGYTLKELQNDKGKQEEIAGTITSRGLKDKDEVEIFAAAFCYSEFYPSGNLIAQQNK